MLMDAASVQAIAARVLFVRAAGVLYATHGSPEVTRRYVWAPLLESLLEPYPDVCVVYLRAQDEPACVDGLKSSLGRLGQRLIDIVDTDDGRLVAEVQHWCRHHPEVAHTRLLVPFAMATDETACVPCDAGQGMQSSGAQSAIRDWLRAVRAPEASASR